MTVADAIEIGLLVSCQTIIPASTHRVWKLGSRHVRLRATNSPVYRILTRSMWVTSLFDESNPELTMSSVAITPLSELRMVPPESAPISVALAKLVVATGE